MTPSEASVNFEEAQGLLESERLRHRPPYLDDLGIDKGVTVSDGLDAELVVLPVTPGLRTFVPEDGAEVIQPYWLG